MATYLILLKPRRVTAGTPGFSNQPEVKFLVASASDELDALTQLKNNKDYQEFKQSHGEQVYAMDIVPYDKYIIVLPKN